MPDFFHITGWVISAMNVAFLLTIYIARIQQRGAIKAVVPHIPLALDWDAPTLKLAAVRGNF